MITQAMNTKTIAMAHATATSTMALALQRSFSPRVSYCKKPNGIKPNVAALSTRNPASTEPVTSESATEESATEEPGEKLPWFEQVLSPAPFSHGTAGGDLEKPPWWQDVLGPLAFVLLAALLYLSGSVPRGVGGRVSFIGLMTMFGGFGLIYFARKARESRGPLSWQYRLVGSAAMLLPAGGGVVVVAGLFLLFL
jgi:hypothetical protein